MYTGVKEETRTQDRGSTEKVGRVGRVGRIFALHLPVEAVDSVHALALVVASGQVEASGVEALEDEQSEDALHGEGPPVHKVAVEKVRIVVGREAVELEDVEKVVELRQQRQRCGVQGLVMVGVSGSSFQDQKSRFKDLDSVGVWGFFDSTILSLLLTCPWMSPQTVMWFPSPMPTSTNVGRDLRMSRARKRI